MQIRSERQDRFSAHMRRILLTGILTLCAGGLSAGLFLWMGAASAQDATQGNQISITQSGFTPDVLTVTVGSTVAWLNDAPSAQTVRSGLPQRIFLPMLSRSGSGRAAARPSVRDDDGAFGATLAAGASFTHTFPIEGIFPFFLTNAPDITGKIVVVPISSTPTPTPTSTATPTPTPSPTPTPTPSPTPTDDGKPLPPNPVDVAPPLDQTGSTDLLDASAFLYLGDNPIQTGVISDTMDGLRVAVLRGKVTSRDGAPLPGVQIHVLDHPEFGQTLSRSDGMFDLAVNGGGQLVLVYGKEGFLAAQRAVTAPWRDFAWLPDVVLIPLDPAVTAIHLDGAAMQVARGSQITDADGSRQATLLFPQGVTGTLVLSDGTTSPLTTVHVRATEYTVGDAGPKAMPAALPPSSGYTYAAEFSLDEAIVAGATDVRFSQPLPVYVENFLGFPVGGAVPTGYYDRTLGQWVASANGRVVKILSITGGLADLDIDGSDTAADAVALTGLGVTDAERAQLAQLYTPGQSLWRVPIGHFTPWDCNWPYGPPPDAIPPDGKPRKKPKPDKPKKDCGSIIGCEDQTLGEQLPIIGTPWQLTCQSDRTPARVDVRTLVIPVSGGTLPASLSAIRVEVSVAGRLYQASYAPAPNLSYTVVWDGLDAYGRPVPSAQMATVQLFYDYTPQFYAARDDFENSFARAEAAGEAVSVYRSVGVITLSQLWTERLNVLDARNLGLGGWSLGVQHAYDPVAQTLLLGDGRHELRLPPGHWLWRRPGRPDHRLDAPGCARL